MIYGCHSKVSPDRCSHEIVWHSKMNVNWKYIMTRDCQYSKDVKDDVKCVDCKFKDVS